MYTQMRMEQFVKEVGNFNRAAVAMGVKNSETSRWFKEDADPDNNVIVMVYLKNGVPYEKRRTSVRKLGG